MEPCPTRDELTRFAEGALDESDIIRIGCHLESCASCRQRIDRRTPAFDSLSSIAPDEYEYEPGLVRTVERVASLKPPHE
jgi:anti-sigma factor ChrR (cupin superfamily)